MKILFTCLAASLALSASSLAQTTSTGTPTGTMTVYAEVPTTSGDAYKTTPTKTTIISEVIIMATSTGQTNYAIRPDGVQYTDPTAQQSVDTRVLYDIIADEAVSEGVARGYHPLTSTGTTTKVYDANSTVHEYSIRYDQSTYAPMVIETNTSTTTVQSTVQ